MRIYIESRTILDFAMENEAKLFYFSKWFIPYIRTKTRYIAWLSSFLFKVQ